MKKTLYIIPGLNETCRRKPYQSLSKIASELGFEVVCINVKWKQPLSTQTFSVSKYDVIFGFSLGAILAILVAQDNQCKHVILGSMTPLKYFKDEKYKKELAKIVGVKFVDDVAQNLKSKHLAKKQTIIYGDKEGEAADIIVPNTGHCLNNSYLEALRQLL